MSKHTRHKRQKVDRELAVTQLFWAHFPKQLEHQHSETVSGHRQLPPLRGGRKHRGHGATGRGWQGPCQPPVLQMPQPQETSSGLQPSSAAWAGGLRAEVQGGRQGRALGRSTAQCAPGGGAWTMGTRVGRPGAGQACSLPSGCLSHWLLWVPQTRV